MPHHLWESKVKRDRFLKTVLEQIYCVRKKKYLKQFTGVVDTLAKLFKLNQQPQR